jgi:Raf kinase inhibitor-like YbhB/YbcL family protein
MAAKTLAIACLCVTTVTLAQDRGTSVEVTGHIVTPPRLDRTPQDIQHLDVPNGFSVNVFAENLGKPRMLAVGDDGGVYVTRREPGDVLVLRDTNGDGRADETRTAVRRPMLHGIALDGKKVYLVGVTDVFSADMQSDGTFANVVRIVDDLPDGGQHANRTIRIGPDKQLYISVGSTCNACNETSPESATILRMSPDGKSRTIFASGLRNTIGFDWSPVTGELFGMDHGIDWLGDDEQFEELNHIEQGKRYGWPYVFGRSKLNPHGQPPGEMSAEEWARLSQEPVLMYTAHAAPMQMVFYIGGQFPAEYRGDAFVAMHGSWNRQPPSGYEVVRIRFQKGTPAKIEPFLTGFLTSNNGQAGVIGRPVGLAIASDGTLLVSDDANGVIYRIAFRTPVNTTASRNAATAGRAVGTSGRASSTPTVNADLAMARTETRAPGVLSVTAPAFAAGQAIPYPYTEYGERFSPALEWSGVPEGTKSFTVLMEDPDARTPRPFVHWLLYNVPGSTTRLYESVPPAMRLVDPAGALQGHNSRGQIGYMGPRPPAGDPPHHYHFQVFALDTVLPVPPGVDRETLLSAMEGHVVARGEHVGTFQRAR